MHNSYTADDESKTDVVLCRQTIVFTGTIQSLQGLMPEDDCATSSIKYPLAACDILVTYLMCSCYVLCRIP